VNGEKLLTNASVCVVVLTPQAWKLWPDVAAVMVA